jgi:hypothetical protein
LRTPTIRKLMAIFITASLTPLPRTWPRPWLICFIQVELKSSSNTTNFNWDEFKLAIGAQLEFKPTYIFIESSYAALPVSNKNRKRVPLLELQMRHMSSTGLAWPEDGPHLELEPQTSLSLSLSDMGLAC